MNKLKNKYPNVDIFLCFSVLILIFWLFCTKLIIKMDDGHFMGILANENFSLAEWLRNRYETVSGRTFSEALMMSFLRSDIILWKLFGFFLFEYIVYFFYKISLSFTDAFNSRKVALVCCSSIFLIFVGVLNAGAFWFAGSFTFLIPCTFMLIAISPALFDVIDAEYNPIHKIIAVPCAVIAASQEQASVCTCMILLCLFVLSLTKKKFRISSFLSFPIALAATIYLFTSPGVANRGTQQAAETFKSFTEFGIFKKLFLGFTNYCSYTFFFSIIVTILFTIFLCAVIRELYEDNKGIKKLCYILPAYVILVSLIYNLIHIAAAGKSIDANLQNAFKNNEMNIWVYLTAILCAVIIALWGVMILLIIRKNKYAGLTIGLFCCAALGCGLMMGFSSSIYASGKRVFFFSELFMIASCMLLFSLLKPSKISDRLLRICITVSSIFYAFDIINFAFVEIPIMN